MVEMVAACGVFFLCTLFWAVTGHWMFLFYQFLWRSGIGMLGLRKAPALEASEQTPAAALPEAITSWFRKHLVSLLGLAGAALAAMAFFWLIEDLVVDDFSKRCFQLGALLLLTTATTSWGVLLRSRGPDILGTGLMLLGFLMLPADAAFYETYILGYRTHSAYKLVLAMSGMAFLLHRKTGSRAFAWISPQAFLLGTLLVGDHLDWTPTIVCYVAALLAPLLLGFGEWVTGGEKSSDFLRPIRLAAFLASGVALIAALGSTPDIFPALHLMVALLGGATVAAIGFLELDLRALLLLIPYFAPLALRNFEEYGTGFGMVGPLAAFAGLGLLALERVRRQGRDRQRGLDPWCAVPAMMFLLFAFIADGTAGISLLDKLRSLGSFSSGSYGDPQYLVNLWAESQRAVYYMTRLDGILLATMVSGVACSLGLAYLAATSGIPLLGVVAGVPLATASICGVNYLLPFELHGEVHWMIFAGIIVLLTLRSIVLDRRPTDAITDSLEWYPVRTARASACRIAAHLLVPVTYLMAGHWIFDERSVPGWFSTMMITVIGFQCVIRYVRGGGSVQLRNLGVALISAGWPLSLFQISTWSGDSMGDFLGLAIVGLAVLGTILWLMVTREQWLPTAFAVAGVAGILLAMVDKVAIGGMFSKIVVLGFGLMLLWLGARGRRSTQGATMLWMLLVISVTSTQAQSSERVTAEALQQLGATNPEDPLIKVRLRAAGQTAGTLPTSRRWQEMQQHLAALSGIDSMAAALQIASSPVGLRVPENRRQFSHELPGGPQLNPLDFGELANQLGRPLPPARTDDLLELVPSDRIYLRFRSPDSLGRILAAYDSAGRSVLKITAPQLALPGPESLFRRALGVSLTELVQGGGEGVISIGDPYLAIAEDAALLLAMPGEAEAQARAHEWSARFGPSRVHTTGKLAVLATHPDILERIAYFLQGKELYGELLASQPDFRYAKLLELPSPDGYFFVSEDCISGFVSAYSWVTTNRRADCLADLAELEAACWFGKSTGRPLSADPGEARREAVVRGWLMDGTRCRDDGETSAEGAVMVCSVHGSRLTPRRFQLDRSLRIDPEEATAYREFSQRYERLYRQFIDPIAIGIEVREGHTMLETVILPVARQPYYLTLQSWGVMDHSRMPLKRPAGATDALVSLAFKGLPHPSMNNAWLGYYSWYRDPAIKSIRRMMENGGLGQTVGLTLLPGDLSLIGNPPEMAKDPRPIPVLAYHDVGNPERAVEYMASLFGQEGRAGAGDSRHFEARIYGRKELHAGVDRHAVVLGSDRASVEKALADGGGPATLPGGLAWMRVRPKALWQTLAGMPGLSIDAFSETCVRVMGARQNVIEIAPDGGPTPPGVPTGEPFFDPRARCPAGGEYRIAGGEVQCSLHGSSRAPRSAPPAPGSPLETMLDALDFLELELAMSPGGIRTRLVIESARP